MSPYRVSEWGRIPFQSAGGEAGISRQDAERLCAASEGFAKAAGWAAEDVLSFGRSGIQAKQAVGVIQSESCRLEILPKIDTGDDSLARQTLIGMLASVHDFTVSVGAQAATEEQSEDVLESLIGYFLSQLEREVRRGLPRQYIAHQDDLKFLRGSLNVTRQFTVHAAAPDRLACRYDELSPDTPLSRLLKSACRFLSRISLHPGNRRRAGDLLNAFDGVSDLEPGRAIHSRDIFLDRTNSSYRALREQALLFLRHRWQSVYNGRGKGFALLFQMNDLFEAYIGKSARRFEARLHCDVRLQGPQSFALEADAGTRHFKTKPDICIDFGSGLPRTLIDTKWKSLERTDRGAPWGISNADIYQMLTYSEVYNAGRVILLFPHSANIGKAPGLLDRFYSRGRRHQIDVATIDLARLGSVGDQLSHLLHPGAAT